MACHSPPILLERQLDGTYSLSILVPLANAIAPSLSDQRCSNINYLGLRKRELVPLCTGSVCPVVNAILAMRSASALTQYTSSWLYASSNPPNLESDYEPTLDFMERYAKDNHLFERIYTLDPDDQNAKLKTISETFLGLAFIHQGDPSAPLTANVINFSDYTCSAGVTVSVSLTSSCSQMIATFTSPVTAAMTFVCPHTFPVNDSHDLHGYSIRRVAPRNAVGKLSTLM